MMMMTTTMTMMTTLIVIISTASTSAATHFEQVKFDFILTQINSLARLSTVEVISDDEKSEVLGQQRSLQPFLHRHHVIGLGRDVVDLSLQLISPEMKIFQSLTQALH